MNVNNFYLSKPCFFPNYSDPPPFSHSHILSLWSYSPVTRGPKYNHSGHWMTKIESTIWQISSVNRTWVQGLDESQLSLESVYLQRLPTLFCRLVSVYCALHIRLFIKEQCCLWQHLVVVYYWCWLIGFPNGSLPRPPASILIPNPISPPLLPSFNPFSFNAKQCNTMGSVTLDRNTVIFNFQDFLSPTLSSLKI